MEVIKDIAKFILYPFKAYIAGINYLNEKYKNDPMPYFMAICIIIVLVPIGLGKLFSPFIEARFTFLFFVIVIFPFLISFVLVQLRKF